MAEARREGRRLRDVELSEKEAAILDAQRHDFFSDWSEQEKEKFKAEQASMWSLIPEHLRGKAARLASGN